MMVESEPIDLNQAMKESNWLISMKKELKAIEKNITRELVSRSDKKAKWIYMLKLRPNGEISKYKERLG